MERDVLIAIVLAVAFSLLISVIEVAYQSKARSVRLCCGSMWYSLYVLILILGNFATTLAAAAIMKPTILGRATAPATAPEPHSGAPIAPPISAGLPWFWYAFVGVFAFEAVLQRVNVTFVDHGFLTISDWINKARDGAVASAIASQVDAQVKREQALASKLVQAQNLSDADLNTYVQNWLGPARVQELEQAAQANNANPRLAKAIALATGAYDRAATLL